MTRYSFIILSVLLMALGSFNAEGQRMDRGIDLSSQPCFIKKGTWMVGGGAKLYASQQR